MIGLPDSSTATWTVLVRQPGLCKPAGQVLRGAQPLGLLSPLARGGGEVQAGAAAQEAEPLLAIAS